LGRTGTRCQGDRPRDRKSVVCGALRKPRQVHRGFHGARPPSTAATEETSGVLMQFMLDTTICIHVIRKRPRSVLDRFASHAVGDIGVSTITLAELEYGVSASSRPAKNREALDQFMSPLDLVPFDREATSMYGRLRATLEKREQTIGSMDLLIAAHAVRLDVRLITHHVREFGRVPGLKIEDWT